MRKYIIIFITLLLTILSISAYLLYSENVKLEKELSISRSNEKALLNVRDSVANKNRILQLTTEQLEYYNDSILNILNRTRRELKIKDEDLRSMQYLLSEASKKDTLYIRDTIFKDKTLDIDSLFIDEWYTLRLGLKYPNRIAIDPQFKSELHIITNYRRETINPPKKCIIGRWFQKKHTIVEVNVIEKSPYIQNKEQKYIEVLTK